MIESIKISGIATYGSNPEFLRELSKINFFFGSNGSGKTTITRIIADEGKFPCCSVSWKGGIKLQALVYNQDFIAKNFSQSSELKGIFTLGEKNIDTLNRINATKTELDKIKENLEKLHINLNGEDGTGGKNPSS
jgi:wobble nucleotide-excising tRNase